VYIVVFRDLREEHRGVVSWVSFQSKTDFDERYNEEMRGFQQVVEEGITQERAIELCSTSQATRNWWISRMREDGLTLLIGPPK